MDQKYVCSICYYTYFESDGDPDFKIEPGTKFEDLPESWCCPECGAPKEDFNKFSN